MISRAISSCSVSRPLSWRSYWWAQSCAWSRARISWAVTRTVLASRRTLPEQQVLDPQLPPDPLGGSKVCLKCITEARAITPIPAGSRFPSWVIISSVRPSLKYS